MKNLNKCRDKDKVKKGINAKYKIQQRENKH